MKLLVADDDAELRGLIAFALQQAGYLVLQAQDGPEALRLFAAELPDLVILDVNMPGMNGFEVCRRLRQQAQTPIMMLTVRNSEEDQLLGLNDGADDYLTKPFSPRMLTARVRALLRRAGGEAPAPLGLGLITVDSERQTATVGAAPPVALTNRELRLLQYLLANAGRVVTVEQATTHIWGLAGLGDRQLLKQLVHRLRQKLEPDPHAPRFVLTVPGIGYCLQVDPQ